VIWHNGCGLLSVPIDSGGALNQGSVEALAERLGLGARQLHRLFTQHLGHIRTRLECLAEFIGRGPQSPVY